MLRPPSTAPDAFFIGVAWGMKGKRVPLGRSPTATMPRTARFSQCDCHRRILVAHRPTVRPIEAPRHAPAVAADLRHSADQIICSLVEGSDQATCIGCVGSNRQNLQEAPHLVMAGGPEFPFPHRVAP